MLEGQHWLWESPDGKVAVDLAFDVVDAINAAIQEASLAAPVRGAEIGGLLLGSSDSIPSLKITVERVELLPCRYARGPSFHPEPEDSAESSRPDVVGFFRSHTRKDLFLTKEEVALLAPDFVFVLVKPFKTRPNSGAFFYSTGGEADASGSAREFVFHRRELGGGAPQPVAASGAFAAEPEPLPPSQKQRPVLLWAMMAFLAFAASGSLAYILFTRISEPSAAALASKPAVGLGLTLWEGDRDITVRWDRQSPRVRAAAKGIIEIQEGSFEKSVPMDADQLRTGSLVYSRPVVVSDLVNFRLRLFFPDGPPETETVQLISNRQAIVAGPPAPAIKPELAAPPELKPGHAQRAPVPRKTPY